MAIDKLFPYIEKERDECEKCGNLEYLNGLKSGIEKRGDIPEKEKDICLNKIEESIYRVKYNVKTDPRGMY